MPSSSSSSARHNNLQHTPPPKAAAAADHADTADSSDHSDAGPSKGLGARLGSNSLIATPTKYKLREASDILKRQMTEQMDAMRLSPQQSASLYAGACFRGQQRGGRTSYDVTVRIQDVDLKRSFMCGYLQIRGLTEEFPELTTFFEAEIIGTRHKFLTRKWDADEHVDRKHWSKFPAFEQHCDRFNADNFQLDVTKSNHIFMRWKEQFLVPDHRIRSITGASYAGFYYVCLDVQEGIITGYYYHHNSEMYQQLILKLEQDSPASQSFEFR